MVMFLVVVQEMEEAVSVAWLDKTKLFSSQPVGRTVF